MPINVPNYVQPQASVTDPYYGDYSALAQQFLRNPQKRVYSPLQGAFDVLGDVGQAYFEKQARDKAQEKQGATNAAIAQALANAGNSAGETGQQAQSAIAQASWQQPGGGQFPTAQSAFSGGAPPAQPGAGGNPMGQITPAQPAFNNNEATSYQKAVAALMKSNVPPQAMLQAMPAALQAAQASIPKVDWQNTGSQLTPFDQYGRPMQGPNAPKPIPVGLTPQQQAQLDIEKGNLTVNQKREALEEEKSGWIDTKDSLGNPFSYNRNTGDVKRPNGVADESAETIGPMAKGIANYNLQPLSSVAMLRPFGQAVMAQVMKENPDYDAKFYNSAKSAKQNFASGKNGQLTRQANTSTSHLLTLQALGDALDNGDINVVNSIKNRLSSELGNVPIAGYEAAAKVVGDEVNKFISGGPGAHDDRAAYAKSLSSARSKPQRDAAINALKGLMVGQLNGLQRQYTAETHSKDFGDKLEPEVAAMLDNPQYATGNNPTIAPPTGSVPPPSGPAAPKVQKWGRDARGNPVPLP